MNAHALTAQALTGALTKIAVGTTVDDVAEWGRSVGQYPHFRSAVYAITGLDAFEPIDKVKARIERMTIREENKRDREHWSYDANRHVALKQMADHIALYESRRAA
ncbi:hypothetical protein JYP46_01360 [Nitratireductor aquimarinus]|uniref:hypothetical protein n=1 Tax=Alphaproteobacteria TaxID=28211 RepID=UPI0019D370BC|nr:MULTISPECIES: hypothetical protein [Alphaproteobacteria]MBN7755458.1 hypothetical protein [Nitratireductor aquimarinus]MBY5998213.1 hypothetical protein [Tritonibacter mobilis]MBY6020240.1 hypothetical protein [Nitratireductor sp. DP7N14-4]